MPSVRLQRKDLNGTPPPHVFDSIASVMLSVTFDVTALCASEMGKVVHYLENRVQFGTTTVGPIAFLSVLINWQEGFVIRSHLKRVD